MLYISRYIYHEKCGVVDTDDNSETIITMQELRKYVSDGKVKIYSLNDMNWVGDQFFKWSPYQPLETTTPLQVKTNLMKHVSVICFRESITQIVWDSDRIQQPVSIRLSDFGVDMADCVLFGNSNNAPHCLTLIFDDDIGISPHTLEITPALAHGAGLKLDVREVTKPRLLSHIYKQWCGDVGSLNRFQHLIDHEWRRRQIYQLYMDAARASGGTCKKILSLKGIV